MLKHLIGSFSWINVCASSILPLLAGCWSSGGPEVVVYSALDREFSEPILTEFERISGIDVLPKYDIESTKTVGLATAIIHERNRPRCDLFWNNEILHTYRLEKLGRLDVYRSPAATDIPVEFRSPGGYWHGFAGRARILIVNKQLLPNPEDWPTSIQDLTDPKWRGKCGIAAPRAGTTATHAAVLFAEWGDVKAKAYFQRVRQIAEVRDGNKQVARRVAQGKLFFGITDTDDAIVEIDRGYPVAIVFPDQGEHGIGSLFVPNTLCLIKNSPNPRHARQLVDFLLKPATEARLARGSSAQIPVNSRDAVPSRVNVPADIKWMKVDFEAAATAWDSAAEYLLDKF